MKDEAAPKDKAATEKPTEKLADCGRGDSRSYGHIVEWRLKPGSEALDDVLPYNDVGKDWKHMPYDVAQLPINEQHTANRLIRPYVKELDGKRIGHHGLVTKVVAEAVLACFKTALTRAQEIHCEFRIKCVRVHEVYTLTTVVEGSDDQVRKESAREMLDALDRP